MMNIGFDFGTTNSIISYYNQERQQLECFRITADSSPYIPTMIAYEKSGISIGESAKVQIGSPYVYSHFKLPLADRMDEELGGHTKTVHQVTSDYIKSLLECFKQAGNSLGKIMVTIPNSWYQKDSTNLGKENIRTIFDELNIKDVQFQSEPIAAAAYFCWLYQYQQPEKNAVQKPYNGKLLIIDYGGGTLDVTLCAVGDRTNICVIDSVGYGEEQENSGCAGSAFDDEVIRILCKENNIELNEKEFVIVKNEFEKTLIARSDACTRSMQEYFEFPEGLENEPIFRLNLLRGIEVCCKHLMQAFDTVCRPVLEEAIGRIAEKYASSVENLQVLMVGGFSNFCCVEAVVRELLNSRTGASDLRFTGILNQENKALAVAKGAALLANGVVKVSKGLHEEVGIILYGMSKEQGYYSDIYMPLLKKCDDITKYKKTVYGTQSILLMPESATKCKIRFYVGNEGKCKSFETEINIAELLKNSLTKPTMYQIGMRITENESLAICLRDSEGKEYTWNMENNYGNADNQRIFEHAIGCY